MIRFIAAVCASVLSAVYWWIIFTMVYIDVLFAGDRSPTAAVPSEHDALLRSATIIAVGMVIYAMLLMLLGRWRAGSRRKA